MLKKMEEQFVESEHFSKRLEMRTSGTSLEGGSKLYEDDLEILVAVAPPWLQEREMVIGWEAEPALASTAVRVVRDAVRPEISLLLASLSVARSRISTYFERTDERASHKGGRHTRHFALHLHQYAHTNTTTSVIILQYRHHCVSIAIDTHIRTHELSSFWTRCERQGQREWARVLCAKRSE